MISRRDILMATACLTAAAASLALKPTRLVSLLAQGQKLDAILPRSFGDWSSRDVSDMFAPESEDSIEAKLYAETAGRLYFQASTGTEILMLMAHGDVQSNELQLHRPEVCYPAFGFEILSSEAMAVYLAPRVVLPARRLIAQSPREELATIYWTRLGEYLPTSGTEQRWDRIRTAVDGYVPDGLLARFSIQGTEPERQIPVIQGFISTLVSQVATSSRGVLIGTDLAKRLERRVARS
jgi:EpsI family protein